ncbi:MAG: 3-hydroxyacyl-CoA dehydrogenase NAD-binding domain-containing protein [Bryobacterales bacterium]|nr:3-hydroxyacyl-CoA dehydrogenase NAD-binding domain-containing protein [Bryobacterales bacterium]
MSELVRLSVMRGVGVITVDNPPVNALSPGVPEGILAAVEQFGDDGSVAAIVLIGGGRTFIAGADIKEFGKITAGQQSIALRLTAVIERLENSPKPTVAAIHGTAFGGGLEIAQGCHYRVALAGAQVGQPEVKLGIIPGAQGTQRLPRLAGVQKAVEMCALGEPVSAADAHAHGLVDRVIEGSGYEELLAGAVDFSAKAAAAGGPHPKASERNERLGTPREAAAICDAARAKVRKARRGQAAPLKAIDAVQCAVSLPFSEGVKREAGIFRQCLFSAQCKSLIHAFFAERQVRKVPDVPKHTPTRPIRSAAVLGAGTMGGGIAMCYANAGIPVRVKEVTREALERGVATIRKNYERSLRRGRFTPEFVEQRLALITPQTGWEGFESADIVVEAVFEDMALKKEIFRQIDSVARPGAVLATNTSTLDVDEIAAVTARPRDVIGHHFFSPANVMRLLEIVRGSETAKDVVATSLELARTLRKVGVLVGNCHGFVGNRMFNPYQREAQFLAEEGAAPSRIDRVLYEFGAAMGPLAVADLAGLDIGMRVRQEAPGMYPPGTRRPLAGDALCRLGRLGQKTGAGWYRYGEDRSRHEDPAVDALLRQVAAEAGIERRDIGDEEIRDRAVYALVNEGARILEEGYALRSSDIDVIYLYGYGFPAYRGGPMFYADTVGLAAVVARLEEFHAAHGHWWRPAPLLKELAERGLTFAERDQARA